MPDHIYNVIYKIPTTGSTAAHTNAKAYSISVNDGKSKTVIDKHSKASKSETNNTAINSIQRQTTQTIHKTSQPAQNTQNAHNTHSHSTHTDATLEIIFIDTCQLVPELFPETSAGGANPISAATKSNALYSIERLLARSTATWLIVAGHYTIFRCVGVV